MTLTIVVIQLFENLVYKKINFVLSITDTSGIINDRMLLGENVKYDTYERKRHTIAL